MVERWTLSQEHNGGLGTKEQGIQWNMPRWRLRFRLPTCLWSILNDHKSTLMFPCHRSANLTTATLIISSAADPRIAFKAKLNDLHSGTILTRATIVSPTQCYDPRTWLGTPHVMSTNHVTSRRPLDGPPSEYSTCSMSSVSSCSALDKTSSERPDTFYIKI